MMARPQIQHLTKNCEINDGKEKQWNLSGENAHRAKKTSSLKAHIGNAMFPPATENGTRINSVP